jgi:YggT family protein
MPTPVLFTVLMAAGTGLLRILDYVVELYVVLLIARALLSWFPSEPGTTLYGIVRGLDRLTEPLLRPIRRALPPVRAGGMAIDLSIIVAIIGLEVLLGVINNVS